MEIWTVWLNGLWIVLALMTLVWLLSVSLRNAGIVDPFWGLGFVLAAWYYSFQAAIPSLQQQILLVMVSLWVLRLFAYLAWRNFGKDEDYRYRQFRENYGEKRYWWVSFFQVFMLQGVLLWLVSITLLGGFFENSDNSFTLFFVLGVLLWATGFFFEAIGDWQLTLFKANPANKGRVLDHGLWRYTRHPNYFGEACLWWGYALIAISNGYWWSMAGAVLMTWLLVRVSGVSLLEKNLKTRRKGYLEYMQRTPAFFPWFPKS
jgi:steroid 5-alpha reductase family enzyme